MQTRFDGVCAEIGFLKNLFIRHELNHGSCITLPAGTFFCQVTGLFSAFKALIIDNAVFFDRHFQPLTQGIDNRCSDTMKAAGDLVVSVTKFSTCVEHGINHLHGRQSRFLIDPYRNTSAVIDDGN